MLKAPLIFVMFLCCPPCCSLGDKKTDTAFLTLLLLRHLAKAHFLLVHVNFSGGITETVIDHQSIGFGLCEKESLLQWSSVSELGQLPLFCVYSKAEEIAEKWG